MSIQELRQKFSNADPKFGPVPFWWWSAEEVTAERVRWQLQKFRSGGLRNIGIINIAPTGPQYGSVADNPAYFSEQWWEMFEVALRECERLGMRLYFYDQIGFSGSNFPARIVAENPDYTGYHLRRYKSETEMPEGSTVLHKSGEYVYAAVRQGFNWLDPKACALLLDMVHGEFERRFPDDLGKTLAGTFQDELPPLNLWTEGMERLYESRYGEPLLPELAALFDDVPNAGLVRRRVYEIAAELAEQSFFIPISRWHDKYGMILFSDQAGPARKVELHGAQRLYLDYFRTHRWYNAAGTDMDGEVKPHVSMAHLHGGKRVFIEAFHTSGWGGSLEETMHWLIPNFQAGVTLYSAHAVYFSTRGGWWEWAPPDTGWRQPYYEHYSIFADTVSRVSSLLSEGTHVADIAVHYPSYAANGFMSLSDGKPNEHPMSVANKMPNEKMNHIQEVYWNIVGSYSRRAPKHLGALRKANYDYDIADDSALEKAFFKDGKLCINDEQFSVLVLCGTTMMDDAAKAKADEWLANGGWIVAVDVPEDERTWDGIDYVDTPEQAVALIEQRVPKRAVGNGAALLRKTADADIFLLLPEHGELLLAHEPASPGRTVQEQATYRIRTNGHPQLWNPVNGEIEDIAYTRDGEWVEVTVPFTAWPAGIVVCPFEADGASLAANDSLSTNLQAASDRTDVHGVFPAASYPLPERASELDISAADWRVNVVPTLDNRYGDFDLHGERTEFVPVERRHFLVSLEESEQDGLQGGWHTPQYDDSDWQLRLWSEAAYWKASKGETFDPDNAWPVVYSNSLGDMKFRTWAGRMGRVPRRFINLGHVEKGEYVTAVTNIIAPQDGRYWIRLESNAEIAGSVNGAAIDWKGGPEEQTAWIDLKAGSNAVTLQAKAIVPGLIRVGAEVNTLERPALPKWIYTSTPNPKSTLTKTIHTDPEASVQRVRMIFCGRGRNILYVNGTMVTEHGDFNPYIRQGQEEVDVTALWKPGDNEVKFVLPEGEGEVMCDGVVEYYNGQSTPFCTGEEWLDEQGNNAIILHEAVLQFAETESMWLNAEPHPLPNVGWLMPQSVPDPKPLAFHSDPSRIGKPVWLRFPLPAGANEIRIAHDGVCRLWIGGEEYGVRSGVARFPAQEAGAVAAIRIEPQGPYSDADVLFEPIRFKTRPVPGKLGDWRTALSLPHHSGAVEYEANVELQASPRAILDLGHVRGTAEVWIDGKPAGVRVWRPYRYELGAVDAGMHRIRIRVTNTLGTHYEIGRPSHNVGGSLDPKVSYWDNGVIQPEWQKQFAAGGMYGPVRIYTEE